MVATNEELELRVIALEAPAVAQKLQDLKLSVKGSTTAVINAVNIIKAEKLNNTNLAAAITSDDDYPQSYKTHLSDLLTQLEALVATI